jgi:hypothetical protein
MPKYPKLYAFIVVVAVELIAVGFLAAWCIWGD